MCYSADAQDDDCTPSLSHHPTRMASSSDVDDLITIIDRAVKNWTVKTGDNQPGERQKKYLEDPRLSEVRQFIENKKRALNTKDPGGSLTPLQDALQYSIKIVDGEARRSVVRTLIHYFQDQSLAASGFRPSLPMQCLTAEKVDGEATSFIILKSVKLKDVVEVDETETNGATEMKTVMHLAVEKKWKRIVELIYSKNKRIVEAVDAQGYTPLRYAKKLKESSKATSQLNDIIEFLKSELCLTLK